MTSIVGKKYRSCVAGGLLVALPLLTAGCYRATGGGWIPSIRGADRARFSFSAMCRDVTQPDGSRVAALYDGQLEWDDGPVRFHGNVEPIELRTVRCQDVRQELMSPGMEFSGTYQPKDGGASGSFTVDVLDVGTPGANGDAIYINLVGGEFFPYENFGVLQGGNIVVF